LFIIWGSVLHTILYNIFAEKVGLKIWQFWLETLLVWAKDIVRYLYGRVCGMTEPSIFFFHNDHIDHWTTTNELSNTCIQLALFGLKFRRDTIYCIVTNRCM
jgi:hypothetical protein